MTTNLAPVEVSDERRRDGRPREDDPSGEETMRLIAALWDWAAERDLEASRAA